MRRLILRIALLSLLSITIALAILPRPSSSQTAVHTKQLEGIPVSASVDMLEKHLTRDMLDKSLVLGKQFLLNNQKPEGNFFYEYNFITKEAAKEDNQVRQAGALWGLALIHLDRPTKETAKAVARGLEFFDKNSKETDDGRKYIVYPGTTTGSAGTVALVALTLIDFLRAGDHAPLREKYEQDLNKYTVFLVSLRTNNGQFHSLYHYKDGRGFGLPSPYYDGEILLALIKAAKYADYLPLREIVLESAEIMYKQNVEEALRENPDGLITKGFYQWGSMAYYELYTTGWSGVEKYAQRVIDLAYWMIDVHQTLEKRKNTAYAHEGLIVAWELARLTANERAMTKIEYVVDTGLYRLISWQVGSPVENEFLKQHTTEDPKAIGGVMNGQDDPLLRIDVAQHQMHAAILARRYMYFRSPLSNEKRQLPAQQSKPTDVWFEDVQTLLSISSADEEALVRFVTASIAGQKTKKRNIPVALRKDTLPRIAFISVSDGASPALVVIGSGHGIIKAIEQGISHVRLLCKNTHHPQGVKLDIVQNVSAMDAVDLDEPLAIERSLQGIAFDRQTAIAFLPEELVAQMLVDSEQKLQFDTMLKYLEKHSISITPLQELRHLSNITIYHFTTLGFFSDGNEIVRLYRGHRLFDHITKEELLSAAHLAGQYLTQAVDPKGKFIYLYQPTTDEMPKGYNILRHAGTVYAMLELYEITGEVELLQAAHRALEYLLLSVKLCPSEKEEMTCVGGGRICQIRRERSRYPRLG